MTPERWQQVSDALDRALQLGDEARVHYMAQLAQEDSELKGEVESLLASHGRADEDFLKTPVKEILAAAESSTGKTFVGRRLGVYEVVERIAEGGMGEVYRAFRADDQYRKQVAIKVIRRGFDSGFVINRFRNERQILASLDHPNIARLLDGGTTEDGVPYLVMELIEGEPIDDYCERHQLSTVERLKLFLSVCSAVQYAHQRLIVHRDLKPGNILVSGEGTPKLLDFGIAKILDPDEAPGPIEPTLTVFRVLTPGYASPEQIKGEPITTAADVYSLGVILYELLTGHSPYRVTTRSPQDLARAVCESEPEKPSTAVRRIERKGPSSTSGQLSSGLQTSSGKLVRRLSGDLDNIVLMALRKEPGRRYASVEQFGEDVRRHLEKLPVIARKDTARYRTSRFVARHKAAVIAASAAMVVLLVALVVTFREARIAERQAQLARQERARAERRFNDVRKLANSLMFEVHDSIQDLPGATKARKLLVTRALEYLDSLSQEANGDPSLQRELAAAYDKVGDVLGYTGQANLGDFAGAAKSYQKSLAIRESLAAANPADLSIQTELLDEYFRAAFILENTGDFDGALRTFQRAQTFAQKIAPGTKDPKMLDRIAGVYYFSGAVLEKKRDFAAALQSYRQGATIRERIAKDPQAVFARAHLVADYNGIAKALGGSGQLDDAIPMAMKATGIIKQLSESNPGNATLHEWLGESYNIWADLLEDKGDLEAALATHYKAQDIFMQLSAADPSNRLSTDNVGLSKLAIEDILVRQGRIKEGIQLAHQALGIFQSLGTSDLWHSTGMSASYYGLGEAYAALAERAGSSAEKISNLRVARAWYQKAGNVWARDPKQGHADALGHDQQALITKGMARCDAMLSELTARARTQAHPM